MIFENFKTSDDFRDAGETPFNAPPSRTHLNFRDFSQQKFFSFF
jgi:hypothetical protein